MPKVVGIENGSYSNSQQLATKRGIIYTENDFKVTYLVLSDDLTDDQFTILATSGIPPLFYPSFGGLCNKRDAKEETRIVHPVTGIAASLWSVECNFTTHIDGEDENNQGDPTAQRPRTSWAGENEEEHIAEDRLTGEAIMNSCNEPIFVSRPVCYPVLSIKRYESYPFDPTVMLDYANTTNSSEFWGCPVGSALMLPMEVSEETIIDNMRYVEVSYRIKFALSRDPNSGELQEDMWMLKVLHQGNKYRTAAGAVPIVARKNGQPVTVNLADDGTKVADGADPHYLFWNRFDESDFNNLSLGPF